MNIAYKKSKSLKDIETKFKKYPRTNKNRFTRNLINLLYLLNPHTPLQMVSEPSNLKSTEEIYVRVRFIIKVRVRKNLPTNC